MAEARRWSILDSVARVQLDVEVPLMAIDEPPRIARLTVLRKAAVGGRLCIVATKRDEILLHESLPNSPGIFYLARDFVPKQDDAAGPRVLSATAERLPDRLPDLPLFSGISSVGFLGRGRGKYVLSELQATALQPDNTVPFITFRSDNEESTWDMTNLAWTVVDDAGANPHWTTHQVIAHDDKLWWANLSRGLVVCDPLPVQELLPRLEFVPLPVLDGHQNRHEPPQQIIRYRTVGVSNGEMRFVDIARRPDEPQEDTQVVVWTLVLAPLITDATWEQNDGCLARLGDIWESDTYAQTPMAREVPVVALVHPNQPTVVYFFLQQYLFSVNVQERALVQFAELPERLAGVPAEMIHQRHVIAWVHPANKLELLSDLNDLKDGFEHLPKKDRPAEG